MSLLKTYSRSGGFCILDWVFEADYGWQFYRRMFAFFVLSPTLGTVLNIAWLAGIGRK